MQEKDEFAKQHASAQKQLGILRESGAALQAAADAASLEYAKYHNEVNSTKIKNQRAPMTIIRGLRKGGGWIRRSWIHVFEAPLFQCRGPKTLLQKSFGQI